MFRPLPDMKRVATRITNYVKNCLPYFENVLLTQIWLNHLTFLDSFSSKTRQLIRHDLPNRAN